MYCWMRVPYRGTTAAGSAASGSAMAAPSSLNCSCRSASIVLRPMSSITMLGGTSCAMAAEMQPAASRTSSLVSQFIVVVVRLVTEHHVIVRLSLNHDAVLNRNLDPDARAVDTHVRA